MISPENDATRWQDDWWRYIGVHVTALVLAVGILAGIWLLARPLALVFFSMVIASALSPIVRELSEFMPRTAAVALIFLIVVLFFAVLLVLIIPAVVDQAEDFGERIPQSLDYVEDRLHSMGILQDGESLWDRLFSSFDALGAQAISVSLVVFSGGVDVVLMFITSLYMLIEAPGIQNFVLSLVPSQHRERFESVADEMLTAAGGYVKGVIWQGLLVGTVSFLGFVLIGLEFPLLLACIMGFGEVLPNIGPLISGAIAVAAALLISPTAALITLIFAIVIQQIESNLLTPYVMHMQANISPLMVIIAVFAGGAVGGILGVIIAIPLTAALRVFVVRVVAPAIKEKTGASAENPGIKNSTNHPN